MGLVGGGRPGVSRQRMVWRRHVRFFSEGSTRDSNFLLPLPPRPRAAGPGGGVVRCGAVRCGAVRCGAVRCGAVRGAGGVVWCGAGVVWCAGAVRCAGEMQAACSVLLS